MLGGIAGALVLGVGGRIAMRGVAILQEWTPYFTMAGSMTVVLMGTLAGAAGAVILLILWSIPRLPRSGRVALFWVAAILITLRILQPLDRERILTFTPVVVVYGLVQLTGVTRLIRRHA